MNFAAPALLLVLLLLPGVIARGAYQRGNWSSHPFRTGAIGEEIALGSLAAVVLHIAAALVARLWGFQVRPDLVLALLYGPSQNSDLFKKAVDNVTANIGHISTYMVTLYAAAWCGGYCLYHIVRGGKVDLQVRPFRFSHEWHYLFSGEILDVDRRGGPWSADQFEITVVALLLDQQDGSYIYRGWLRHYFFDKDGQLDTLVLRYPERAKLCDVLASEKRRNGVVAEQPDASSEAESTTAIVEPFSQIPGDMFVIRAADIRNINIRYLTFD